VKRSYLRLAGYVVRLEKMNYGGKPLVKLALGRPGMRWLCKRWIMKVGGWNLLGIMGFY